MTRLHDDQTGGEGRGVRIPMGIGAGFCGYPCGYICGHFCGYQCGCFCGYQCGYFATTRQQRRGAATMRQRGRRDNATTTMRRDDDATRRCGRGDGAGESLQPSGAPHSLQPGVPHSRCRSQFAAAPQSLQPPGALHSRFSPPASRASMLLFT